VDVSFDLSNAVENTQIISSFIDRHPLFRSLALVIKFFLAQRGLNNSYKGSNHAHLHTHTHTHTRERERERERLRDEREREECCGHTRTTCMLLSPSLSLSPFSLYLWLYRYKTATPPLSLFPTPFFICLL